MEKNSQTKSVFTISGRHRFVACVIVVILVSCAAFAYLASCYKQAQDDIVALQKKDALMFEQVLNSSKNVKSKSSENIGQLQALLDKHQERQEALLHLEYNKLQADLGFGRCHLMMAVNKACKREKLTDYAHTRVATKFPHIAEKFFNSKGMQMEYIKLNGSIELGPIVGLSESIVDIVETGTTLKENNLEEIAYIMDAKAKINLKPWC